jgi:hypothetical protein
MVSETTAFMHLPEVWKDGILPDELRDPIKWQEEINTGSNAPGIENDISK